MISDQRHRRIDDRGLTWLEFLDCEFAGLAMSADCFVDSSIGSTTDETNYFVSIYNPNFTLISHVRTDTSITRIWSEVSMCL